MHAIITIKLAIAAVTTYPHMKIVQLHISRQRLIRLGVVQYK